MPEVRLQTPRVRVTLDDGTVLDVQIRNADMVRWDRTAAKHGWPAAQSAPFLWLSFVAWAALRREGQIPDSLTFEAFGDGGRAAEVRNVTDEDETEDADAADPTLAVRVPG